ncbi:LOW QUALITY PROTEIN: hypothetical protein CRUP_023504, partial [Coryphaenoides rupestris]
MRTSMTKRQNCLRASPSCCCGSGRSRGEFNFKACSAIFHINSCALTAERSLYHKADAIIFYHKDIGWQEWNMPRAPRPPFQKWIWFNVESPTNTGRKAGLENLFNLTLSYRRDADIVVRNELVIRSPQETKDLFVLPKKDKLVCWIVSNNSPQTGATARAMYYQALSNHIYIHVFGTAFTGRLLPYEEYYKTVASCKFYLSFENSMHRDYITEKVNGPLVVGTVPVNYEQFLPAGSFIHVDDFQDPKSLADFLLRLDQSDEEYMRYFDWREFYSATPHLLSTEYEFIHPICLACEHMSKDKGYHSAGEDYSNKHGDTHQPLGSSKPIVLLWYWPLNVKFDFATCLGTFHIDECTLTADRSLYHKADAVIFYHKNIGWDMPKGPRPPFQKWIWYNVESPTNTGRKAGLENLFNLTLSYRRDADIVVRNELDPAGDKGLVCVAQEGQAVTTVPNTGAGARAKYYQQLQRHIKIHVFGTAFTGRMLPYEEYYKTVASCKFYLSFENSMHRDYITEKVNGPLVVGTVPVVMGPPRENYEQFLPAGSFIHVDDFKDHKSLADFLLHLDQSDEEYMRYFDWREFYSATPHLLSTQNEFIHPICLACKHMSTDSDYHVAHELYQCHVGEWAESNVEMGGAGRSQTLSSAQLNVCGPAVR